MSNFPHGPSKTDKFAVAVLAAPLLILNDAAGRIAKHMKRRSTPQAAIPAAPPPQPEQPSPLRAPALVADRVYSVLLNEQKFSFFQYFVAKKIRISTRHNRVLREVEYTPEVAEANELSFDIDGAIQWVRMNGVKPKKASAGKPAPQLQTSRAAPVPAKSASLSSPTLTPPAAGKGNPFTGRILFMGETTRSQEGKRPYVTYSIKLESETGQYSKEFLGEHLSELAAELKLRVGQIITVQLLGRSHFQVEVDGRIEDRNRNQYAITALT